MSRRHWLHSWFVREARFGGIALGLISALLAAPRLSASGAAIGVAKATLGGAQVTIRYGRPKLRGRHPLKMIEPGQVWRMGADIPTTITCEAPLDFGGATVPAGTHFVFVRWVDPGLWTLVISSKPLPQYQPSTKLAEVPMRLERIRKPAEEVTISLVRQGALARLAVSWGTYRLVCSFRRAR